MVTKTNKLLSFERRVKPRIPGKAPIGRLLYDPQCVCNFSEMGESFIHNMLVNAPNYNKEFNNLLSVEKQIEIMKHAFYVGKKEWLAKQKEIPEVGIIKELTDTEDQKALEKGKINKGFFDKRWSWTGLVPKGYKLTQAPRISTTGGTLHGMKKVMSHEVLRLASLEIPTASFVDIDFSACHAHIAAALQNNKRSLLSKAVNQASQFWNDLAGIYTERFESKGICIDKGDVRAMLKVSFYTSLNGGNPFNAERLGSNLKLNSPQLLTPYSSISEFERSQLFKKMSCILETLDIISEVKELNKRCAINNRTYTIARPTLYIVDSQHKGISRVLQGVEVVLLSILVNFITLRNGLPMNLAHDGALVMITSDQSPTDLCEQLSNDMSSWSRYILQGLEMGVEPKISIRGGIISKL